MLERESDWRRFIRLVTQDGYAHEVLAKEMQVGLSVVKGYHDQVHGKFVAHAAGKMPDYLRDKIVGFRYRRLGRWVMTPEIAAARQDYDDGLIELSQGLYHVRDEEAWVLFAFPRRNKTTRTTKWFTEQAA